VQSDVNIGHSNSLSSSLSSSKIVALSYQNFDGVPGGGDSKDSSNPRAPCVDGVPCGDSKVSSNTGVRCVESAPGVGSKGSSKISSNLRF